ncbi:glycosyltransferase [Escherichia coli O157]|nr:glycosyltransferase [Escherichia coli O157]EIH1652422.1 glycosyltransferase [Escherichia coli O157]MBI0888788.1 glycosyltransferase [Escherichia coli]NGK79952.1 glycosyltransferase [Escherichia coli]
MRITQVIPTLSTGGAEQFVISLSNELSKKNDVTLITLFKINDDIIRKRLSDKVTLIELNGEINNKISVLLKLNSVLMKTKHDVIHTHLSIPFYILPFAFFCKDKYRVIHTIHNIARYDAPRKLAKYINKAYFKICKAIPVSISDIVSESVKNYYNLRDTEIIKNGTETISETVKYEEVKRRVNELRKQYTNVFCHIARMDPQKNHRLLIDVLKKNKDCYVISMGAITQDNIKYAKHIMDYSQKISNFEYIGVVDNVSDYIKSSDGIIFSSVYEGLPISLIEGMSVGKICISTPAGGVADILDDECGVLANDFSEAQLDIAIKKFMSFSECEKQYMGYNIRNRFKNEFSISICADKYSQIYENNKS